jgi:hypothetical protein
MTIRGRGIFGGEGETGLFLMGGRLELLKLAHKCILLYIFCSENGGYFIDPIPLRFLFDFLTVL